MKTLKIIFNCIIFVTLILLISCEKEWEEDTTPPQLISTSPCGYNIPIDTEVVAKYNESIDTTVLYHFWLFKSHTDWSKPIESEIVVGEDKIILIPTDPLEYNTEYSAIIFVVVNDFANNKCVTLDQWAFTTEPSTQE